MTTSAQFTSNLKKWFWGFLLGQLVISSAAFFFFTGSVQSTVNTHSAEIDYLKLQMAAKADKEMVMRIKADNDKLMLMIYNDVQYIRSRIDQHMENDKK